MGAYYAPKGEAVGRYIEQEARIRELLVGATVEDITPYGSGVILRRPDGSRVEFSAGGWEFEIDIRELG